MRNVMCTAACFGFALTALADVSLTARATGPGGLLRFADGAAAAEVALETSEPTTLTAEPQSGYFFYRWLGDIAGYDEDALTNATLALDAQSSRALRAVFLRKTGTGSAEFANAVSTCDWFDATSWTAGEIPVAGDAVSMLIKNGHRTIVLSAPTPRYKSVVFSSLDYQNQFGTLKMSGWSTRLAADDIVLDKKAKVTCASGCVEGVSSNRVWLVCENLTVNKGVVSGDAEGGLIDASGLGWGKSSGPGATLVTAQGDAKATFGASHGGYGAMLRSNGQIVNVQGQDCTFGMPLPYGNPAYPTDPGSGGGVSAGGGAVLIQATGTVTVNGKILANDTNGSPGYTGGKGAGSGGSICIECGRFVGQTGIVQAKSSLVQGNWNMAEGSESDMLPGAGGRIAIIYNAALQQPGDAAGVSISAAPGTYYERFSNGTRPSTYRSPTIADRYGQDADLGSVWFTDATLPKDVVGKSLTGQIVSPAVFSCDSLVFTNGHVRFAAEGAVVNVVGDAVVSGAVARLEFGGAYAYNQCVRSTLRANSSWSFTVGGDLSLSEGARLDLRGAVTNGTGAAGGQLTVAGSMTVNGYDEEYALVNGENWSVGQTAVYVWSDAFNGGSPLIDVGTLTVDENAFVSADKRGFASGSLLAPEGQVFGFGPGGGDVGTVMHAGAGGHGGRGGYMGNLTPTGNRCGTYDTDFCRPTLAGSGGGSLYEARYTSFGGGVIHVVAHGEICVNGRISADGETPGTYQMAAGAGGTLLFDCKCFSGSENGIISAKGGNATCAAGRTNGGGGGGRIAVWTGKPWEAGLKAKHCTVYDEPSGTAEFKYLGSTSVAGGISADAGQDEKLKGGLGTMNFVRYDGIPGFLLLVR